MDLSPYGSCDLVMKGGVTSGVVYPRAITELSVNRSSYLPPVFKVAFDIFFAEVYSSAVCSIVSSKKAARNSLFSP
jgi:hypothetical protein